MTAELVKLDPPFRDQAPDEPWLGPKPPGYLVHIKATPLRGATRLGIMSFLGTVTVFGTPSDVTLSELALEMLFPVDEATARIAHAMVEEQERAA